MGGIAWELGVLTGLAEAGVALLDADLVVGTSAGAVVAAQLFSGQPVEELFARQVDGRAAAAELPIPVSMQELTARFAELAADGP
ncbi:MAG: patatin-like phospholipase family protein, partial [Frankiales bacterium]|nr:patatin-like phospholipase family protein [Frankiales bacterium]